MFDLFLFSMFFTTDFYRSFRLGFDLKYITMLQVLTTLAALAVSADTQQAAEGADGHRYGQRVVRPAEEGADDAGDQVGEIEYSPQHDTRSKRTNGQRIQQEDPSELASSYSSVIMHNQEQPMSQTNLQYKDIRGKAVKGRPKAVRQNFREPMVPSYKQYKPIRQGEQPHLPLTQSQQQQAQVPSEQFIEEVHPSVMQRLMKQQPQTFDNPSPKDNVDYDPAQSDDNGAREESRQSNHDISKRPIYVPNRVSVQNPSGDSSFNVGYSIGFGNGFASRPKLGVVDPPISYRQSKGIPYPTSYQSTPVNVHVDGKNSVWKNMGSGVEMSHNLDSEPKHVNTYNNNDDSNDYSRYSSGSVINQPIYFRENFDVPTEGRNTFDHNYALQQSNPFDFSNAIDPAKDLPLSTEQVSDDEESQFSYAESYPKQAFPTYFESFPKPTHPPHSASFMKSSHPSFVDLSQQRERGNQPPHSVSVASSSDRPSYDGYKVDSSSFERPSFVPNRMSQFRVSHPVTLVGKPKPIDFFRSSPINGKQAYNIKTFVSNDFNSNNADLHGGNFEYSSMPMPQQIYDPSAKAAPMGMVQAILVPVNTPIPSYSHQPGVPIMGNGYSPYLGQPIGYVNVPQNVEEHPPHREEFDHSESETDGPSEAQELSPYFKKPPVKMVRSHYSGKHPKMETKYQLHRPTQPRLRLEEQQDLRHSMKYKRVFATESPDISSSEVNPQSLTSHSPSADMSVATSHPPRQYRSRPILIVKRA